MIKDMRVTTILNKHVIDITTFNWFSLCFALKHALPASLHLNHNAYSIFPRIHVKRESMARGTMVHFNFARA